MISECLAIIIILITIALITIRMKKYIYAIIILPLIFVPFAHLISVPIAVYIVKIFAFKDYYIRIVIDIIALIASSITLALIAYKIKSPKTKITYIVSGTIFDVVLACVLILYLLPKQ
jgi:hypothetical protein